MILRKVLEEYKEMDVPFIINDCANLSANEAEFVLDAPVCDLHIEFGENGNIERIEIETLWS